jgi:hypothetical protein
VPRARGEDPAPEIRTRKSLSFQRLDFGAKFFNFATSPGQCAVLCKAQAVIPSAANSDVVPSALPASGPAASLYESGDARGMNRAARPDLTKVPSVTMPDPVLALK